MIIRSDETKLAGDTRIADQPLEQSFASCPLDAAKAIPSFGVESNVHCGSA